MVFRPTYPFPMYPGMMRMPMPMQMPPQSFFPPGGFPIQPRIPSGFPMTGGIGSFGGQMPPVEAPSKIGSFLQSANQFMNTAKTYTPYIQQAMPMVKNIPALFKLYKGFQSLPNADAKPIANSADRSRSRRAPRPETSISAREPIPSRPRIFQPPM